MSIAFSHTGDFFYVAGTGVTLTKTEPLGAGEGQNPQFVHKVWDLSLSKFRPSRSNHTELDRHFLLSIVEECSLLEGMTPRMHSGGIPVPVEIVVVVACLRVI